MKHNFKASAKVKVTPRVLAAILACAASLTTADTLTDRQQGSELYRMWIPGKAFSVLRRPPSKLQGDYQPPEIECAYHLVNRMQACHSIIGSRIPNPYIIGEAGTFTRLIEGPPLVQVIAAAPADPEGIGYFPALCASESGETINVRVTGVRSILALRVHRPLQNHLLKKWSGLDIAGVMRRDPYLLEDPLAYYNAESRFEQAPPVLEQFGWLAFEVPLFIDPPSAEAPFAGVHPGQLNPTLDYPHGVPLALRGTNLLSRVDLVVHLSPGALKGDDRNKVTAGMAVSRYGYFWRGLRFAYDREHRVAGRDLVVVDLATKEVLASQRSFIQWDEVGALVAACPKESSGENALPAFLQRVFPPDPP